MFANVIYTLCVIAGLAAIVAGINVLRVGQSTRSWLPTPAKILTSRVVPGPESSLRASISYRYSFGGTEFESTRIGLVETYSSFRGPAQQVVDRYHPTQQVIAFVNPARPSEAFLEPGAHPGASLIFILTGLVMAGTAGYRLLLALGVIDPS